jgi:hypothetical protein
MQYSIAAQVDEEINLNSCSGYRCFNRSCNSISAIWESPTTYQLCLILRALNRGGGRTLIPERQPPWTGIVFPPKQFQFPTMGDESDISFLPSVPYQAPLL